MPDAVASSPRPLLVGYYGEHNLGDDALLEVLLSQLPPGCLPTVTARDRQLVAARFGVPCVDRTRVRDVLVALQPATALVLGGGSLLQDSTSFRSLLYYAALIVSARLQAKPVLLWAQGLGPLRRRRSRLLVRWLLRCSTACSWRDPASATLARSLGWRDGDGAVGSDPVWAMPTQAWHGHGGPIVLCFRPTSQLQGEAWRPWLEALAALAPERELLWLPLHAGQDRGLLDQLRRQGVLCAALAERSRELLPERPADLIDVCARSGLVLAMRLHGLILAALGGAPVAALSYDPKVRAAAEALGCAVHDLARPPQPGVLLASWRACLDLPPSDRRLRQLRDATGVHRQLLERHLGAAV
ncbi:MAG: polysaccharide pyruvyl transferase CsaB [Cyanobium sp.]|nr:polysaccharide pyruvyl transferase CsaB [Cyanobium sp.]